MNTLKMYLSTVSKIFYNYTDLNPSTCTSLPEKESHEFLNMPTIHPKSTIGKKMAVVHFTTIPCEPNIA